MNSKFLFIAVFCAADCRSMTAQPERAAEKARCEQNRRALLREATQLEEREIALAEKV